MDTLTLSSVRVYPIKSAGGFAAASWPVDDFGLRYDRRWMVVDREGEGLTQREHPRLALAGTLIEGDRLQVTAPGRAPLDLPLEPAGAGATTARVWGDTCASYGMGERAARWFSDLLGVPCGLVYMPEETRRPADPAYAPAGTRVSYVDGFPFLLLSEASLADLNARLPDPVPMNRFRPNLVITGGPAYVEDRLGAFRIGTMDLEAVKPCDRCVLVTTDQLTAERGPEPLRTLASYRKAHGKVLFGQNVIHRGPGRLTVGDALRR
ncbi:MAG TPA: MOSC N-terminal beta barrel domain-containing protein [Gemmatimonadales bacterium]|nr:MOSC N-terminal beta barrel domain-containing protein [Gemmatimonadales bacterium]